MKITINGKEYNSLEEIPYNERKLIDKDNNGEIDILEDSKDSGNSNENTEINIENKININGINYDSIDDIPEEFKDFLNFKKEIIENPKEFFKKISTRNDEIFSKHSIGDTIKSTLAILGIITIIMLIIVYIIIEKFG